MFRVLTRRLFLTVSELQVRVDGVGATHPHRGAVDGAVREPRGGASVSRLGPNLPKIDKETTPGLV